MKTKILTLGIAILGLVACKKETPIQNQIPSVSRSFEASLTINNQTYTYSELDTCYEVTFRQKPVIGAHDYRAPGAPYNIRGESFTAGLNSTLALNTPISSYFWGFRLINTTANTNTYFMEDNFYITITRNDNVINGLLEGTFSGTLKRVQTNGTLNPTVLNSGIPISGSFSTKIIY